MHPQYQQAPGQPGMPGPYPPQPGPPGPGAPYANSPQRPQMPQMMPMKPPGPHMPLGGPQQPPHGQPPFQNGMHSPAAPPNMQGQQFMPRGPAPPQQMQSPLANQMSGLSLSGPQQGMPPAMGKQPPWSPTGAPPQMGPPHGAPPQMGAPHGAPPQMGPPPGAQPPTGRPPMPQQPYMNGSSAPPAGPAPPQGPMAPPPGGQYPPPHMGGPPGAQGGMPPQQMPPQMPGMPPQMHGMPPQMGAPPQHGQMPPQMGMPPMGGPPGAMMAGPTSPQGYQQPPGMMPPKPGFPPQQPGGDPYGRHPQQPAYPQQQQQQQQSRRLDPDQMPSPIMVMSEDQRSRGGVFYTGQPGGVPPLVTTKFVTVDQGNSSPRLMRSTMYNVPATIDMMKQTAIPFGVVISPMAEVGPDELPPPIVDFGEMGPVRCIRCKAYMSPFMQFVDGGRRFHCLLCKATTEVPAEYFQHLDHTGLRVDKHERPELSLGTYEMVATADYCRNNTFPKPPAIIFMIDVSYNNIKSGMVNLLCREMKNIISNLPLDVGQTKSNMKIGFITYSNVVNFYNIKGTLAQPKMLSVSDVNDMFMPLLDGFLVEPEESEEVIDSLMEQIPAMFAESRETETILAPAIQAGLEALKASNCPGKLLVFHSSLPIAEAPGKLKNRDDRKLLGTEKEKTILSPQTTFYNNLGQDCVSAGVSVDLFVVNNSYADVATIGQVCRLTGGEVYKYTYFQADVDGPRLVADVAHNVGRQVAYDSIMRVRTSTGVRPTDFFGHYYMSNTTDMELASIDSDKAVAIEIKHDDKLTEEEGVFIQVALLYTSCGGQRRLRILNLALKTCSQMADLYRACDLDTIINFFAKQSMFKLLDGTPKAVKDALVSRCAQMLACYRKHCASPSSAGQLILPECMKLLPLYANCLLKSDALSGGSDMSLDDRSFNMAAVLCMDLESSVAYFYPRLLPVHDLDPAQDGLPPAVRCSGDKLRDDGAYLLENGIFMFLWVGANVSHEWTQSVFGDHLAAKVEIDPTSLPVFDNPTSRRLRQVLDLVRSQRHRSLKLVIIPQRDKLEMVFKHFLVEDRGVDGSPSYVDFLCHMHKEIRNLLT